MTTRFGPVTVLLAGLVLAGGCGPGAKEFTVLSGRVTIDGAPVKVGVVNVVSDDDIVRTSSDIAPDGTYSIVGAPVGPVKLSVSTEDFRLILPEPGPGAGAQPRANPLYTATPKKYEKFETAELATTVARGKATFDIELKSK